MEFRAFHSLCSDYGRQIASGFPGQHGPLIDLQSVEGKAIVTTMGLELGDWRAGACWQRREVDLRGSSFLLPSPVFPFLPPLPVSASVSLPLLHLLPFFLPSSPFCFLSTTVRPCDSPDYNASACTVVLCDTIPQGDCIWNFEFGSFPWAGLAKCGSTHSLNAGQWVVSHGTQSAIATRGNNPHPIMHHVARLHTLEVRCIPGVFGFYFQRQGDGLQLLSLEYLYYGTRVCRASGL